MTGIEVRVAEPAEYPALATLYAGWGYDGGLTPAEAVFVAYADGATPVGIVRRTREEGVVMLRGMQVAPAAQGHGVGRRLLAAFADALDDRVPCWCVPHGHLLGFYGAAGFRAIADERDAPRFLQERLAAYRARGLDVRVMVRAAIEIREEPPAALAEYARVPIAFEVRERFVVETPDAGLGGLRLVLERVVPPYVKDYDGDPDHHPTAWPRRFDVTRWGILAAWSGAERVGGATVVQGDADVEMLAGRDDVALLWDVRVAPGWRRRGVGGTLFRAAESWALARGARWLEVETQNVNVPACRFYARRGCVLGAVHRFAYPDLPHETQLLWYKPLAAGGG